MDAYFEARDKRAAQADEAAVELRRQLNLLCQQTVAAIADACAGVEANDLAAQVWVCRADDGFNRIARFYLPDERKSSGIAWRKGKGVAGMAWKTEGDLVADLPSLRRKLTRLGQARFNRLPPDERYGMSAKEVRDSSSYTGICATCLFRRDDDPALLGIFVIDYVGKSKFACVAEASKRRPISTYIAACERLLTEARGMIAS